MDLSFMYKAYCDEAKAVFLCLMQKKKAQIRLNLRLWRSSRDLNPGAPCRAYEISSHASSTA